jgi:hypothetical protein
VVAMVVVEAGMTGSPVVNDVFVRRLHRVVLVHIQNYPDYTGMDSHHPSYLSIPPTPPVSLQVGDNHMFNIAVFLESERYWSDGGVVS